MKLGYVSRAHPRDNYNHTVLTVQGYKPGEFASQITLGMNNMWGILKVRPPTQALGVGGWGVGVGGLGRSLRLGEGGGSRWWTSA